MPIKNIPRLTPIYGNTMPKSYLTIDLIKKLTGIRLSAICLILAMLVTVNNLSSWLEETKSINRFNT